MRATADRELAERRQVDRFTVQAADAASGFNDQPHWSPVLPLAAQDVLPRPIDEKAIERA